LHLLVRPQVMTRPRPDRSLLEGMSLASTTTLPGIAMRSDLHTGQRTSVKAAETAIAPAVIDTDTRAMEKPLEMLCVLLTTNIGRLSSVVNDLGGGRGHATYSRSRFITRWIRGAMESKLSSAGGRGVIGEGLASPHPLGSPPRASIVNHSWPHARSTLTRIG
jgi:hypothetical protein